MEMNKKELNEALKAVAPGLGNGMIDGTDCFYFDGERVYTYNDWQCISIPLETDFKLAIKESLFKFTSSLEAEKIKILQSKDTIRVRIGKTTAKFLGSSEPSTKAMIEELDINKSRKLNPLPKDFIYACKMCLFSVGKNAMVPYSTCISVNQNKMASTDNTRLSEHVLDEYMDQPFLLPGSTAKIITRYSLTDYIIDEGWIYFYDLDTDLIIASRLGAGEFPDYSGFFDFEYEEIELPEGLKQSVDASMIFTQDVDMFDKKVSVEIKDGELKVKGKGAQGWIIDKLPCEGTAEFTVNPVFFNELLEHTNVINVGDDKLTFEFDNFRHILMLARV